MKKKKTLAQAQKGLALFKVESISKEEREAEIEESLEAKTLDLETVDEEKEKKAEPEINLLLK